jgi:hypothetical protein
MCVETALRAAITGSRAARVVNRFLNEVFAVTSSIRAGSTIKRALLT